LGNHNTWLKSKEQAENKEINNKKRLEFKQPQQPSNTNSNNNLNTDQSAQALQQSNNTTNMN